MWSPLQLLFPSPIFSSVLLRGTEHADLPSFRADLPRWLDFQGVYVIPQFLGTDRQLHSFVSADDVSHVFSVGLPVDIGWTKKKCG